VNLARPAVASPALGDTAAMPAFTLRSKLFVPASRPDRFAKALAAGADAVAFDLEDAVAADQHAAALAALAAGLREMAVTTQPLLIVRTRWSAGEALATELAALPLHRLAMINLPKVEQADQVSDAARRLEALAHAQAAKAPGLLLTIETPRGLRLAHELACAHPRVAGLQLGLSDLLGGAGIARDDAAAAHQVMLGLRLAAAEAGCFALDSAYTELSDETGLAAQAQRARRLGYAGKSCIHPAQVAVVNAAFEASAEEVDAARRLLRAADQAGAAGQGAFRFEGRMVDAAHVRAALALLARQGG
jgi:citrate lyase subunit beta/citryl-CoA lyase